MADKGSREIWMSEQRLTDEIRFGCFQLKMAHKLPLYEVFAHADAADVTISLKGETPAPWDDINFVTIYSYRFPKGKSEFESRIQFFSDTRKTRGKIREGIRFEPGILAVANVSEAWEHDGFARSAGDIMHVYTSKKFGLLIRYFARSGSILDHPLLSEVHKNLRIIDDQWVQEFPTTQPLKKQRSQVAESEMDEAALSEITEAIKRAKERLGLTARSKSDVIINAIASTIDDTRSQKRLSADEKQQLAIDLGCLWADTVRRKKKWQWATVPLTPTKSIHAICHPTRSHAVAALSLVHDLLKAARKPNNSALLFNMIVEDKLPQPGANAICWLS
jgi:hypothetical protein